MTLTEQWDKGGLPEGDYYIKRRNGDFLCDNIHTSGVWRNSIDEDILEVLAPVPSYEEYKKLKELLKECRETIEISVWGNCSALTDQIDEVIGEKK